ncbi:MAG: peptidase M1 [Betaproteobacteria bacterium HGW-Betaproteobacteria-12]|nr:MAG: peptidase M1 [Betaproteobacteria bacterium HGW-Betaproteobacteria-12]
MPTLIRRLVGLGLLLVAGLAGAALPHLELDVRLEPASGEFAATAELTPAGREFRFVLHETLSVSALSINGRPQAIERLGSHAGYRQWRIVLPKPGAKLRLSYGGRLPGLETQRDHRQVLGALPPMSSPAGSFLPSGSAWYPLPAGLFSYRLTLSLPAEQRGLVAGRRLAEQLPTSAGERYRATFAFTRPTDGIDLMAGPWRVREHSVARPGGETLRLRTYFPAELDAVPGLADAYLADSARFIERFSNEIGAYPYSEFSVVASPLPTGFGMPTLTYLGESVLRLPFIRQTSLGHEILHNWWGNGVYVDYPRGNWSEGLTTLMADYAFKAAESPAAAAAMRQGWLRDAAALPAAEQPALRQFRGRTHGADAAVGYGKAAMLFVMLRDRLGEAAFQRGIRDFWTRQQFRVAGWADLQTAFEAAAGQPLGPFFATWLDQPSLPAIRLEDAELRTPGGRYRLQLTLSQDGPPLTLRLPLEVAAGERRATHWLEIAGKRTQATLELDFPAETVRLDPEFRVWRRLEPAQLPPILRRWIGSDAPQLVNLGRSPESRAAVEQLASRFYERPPRALALHELTAALNAAAPVLIAGLQADVDAALVAAGLPGRPTEVRGQGSAQVWTLPPGATTAAPPLAVIAADDVASLNALQRGLPHYGSQSWLVFTGSRMTARGVWPAEMPALPIRVTGEAGAAKPRR